MRFRLFYAGIWLSRYGRYGEKPLGAGGLFLTAEFVIMVQILLEKWLVAFQKMMARTRREWQMKMSKEELTGLLI